METTKELFTRQQFKCSECGTQNTKCKYEATKTLLMCSKCFKKRDKKSIVKRNISYVCESCLKEGCVHKLGGIILCNKCNHRFVLWKKTLTEHSYCINDSNTNCQHPLCNKCFCDRIFSLNDMTEYGNTFRQNLMSKTIVLKSYQQGKTYQDFLLELPNLKKGRDEKEDEEKIKFFDNSTMCLDNIDKIIKSIVIHINNNSTDGVRGDLALGVALGIYFNIRPGFGNTGDTDNLGVFSLSAENFIITNNYVTLFFKGKAGTICNKRVKLEPVIQNFLMSKIKGKNKIFSENVSFYEYRTSNYLREISNNAGVSFKNIKVFNSSTHLRFFLIDLSHKPLHECEYLEKLEKFLNYVSGENDHSYDGISCVLEHYIDLRLILGFFKTKNIYPANYFNTKSLFNIMLWAAIYIEASELNFKRFSF